MLGHMIGLRFRQSKMLNLPLGKLEHIYGL